MCGNITYNVNLTEQESSQPGTRRETALLAAAKSGIEETVDAILDRFLKAIEDEDNQKKNLRKRVVHESVFCHVDANGNSALHLASPYDQDRHWLLPGPALQMKWEVLWHQALEGEFAFSVFAISSLAALCTSILRNKLENATYLIFAVMCLPVTLFAIAELPFYLYTISSFTIASRLHCAFFVPSRPKLHMPSFSARKSLILSPPLPHTVLPVYSLFYVVGMRILGDWRKPGGRSRKEGLDRSGLPGRRAVDFYHNAMADGTDEGRLCLRCPRSDIRCSAHGSQQSPNLGCEGT
ncbi:hypothetical protein CRG98_022053 [Punica granatum]|uniref:PGG domain-containing protein n=1 Tax=Punica granatum TaxID=22663 RepID=A0A2I0JMS5_PUNGR|nr:hypothetical protein CRG98_022053 [Punica granatum]